MKHILIVLLLLPAAALAQYDNTPYIDAITGAYIPGPGLPNAICDNSNQKKPGIDGGGRCGNSRVTALTPDTCAQQCIAEDSCIVSFIGETLINNKMVPACKVCKACDIIRRRIGDRTCAGNYQTASGIAPQVRFRTTFGKVPGVTVFPEMVCGSGETARITGGGWFSQSATSTGYTPNDCIQKCHQTDTPSNTCVFALWRLANGNYVDPGIMPPYTNIPNKYTCLHYTSACSPTQLPDVVVGRYNINEQDPQCGKNTWTSNPMNTYTLYRIDRPPTMSPTAAPSKTPTTAKPTAQPTSKPITAAPTAPTTRSPTTLSPTNKPTAPPTMPTSPMPTTPTTSILSKPPTAQPTPAPTWPGPLVNLFPECGTSFVDVTTADYRSAYVYSSPTARCLYISTSRQNNAITHYTTDAVYVSAVTASLRKVNATMQYGTPNYADWNYIFNTTDDLGGIQFVVFVNPLGTPIAKDSAPIVPFRAFSAYFLTSFTAETPLSNADIMTFSLKIYSRFISDDLDCTPPSIALSLTGPGGGQMSVSAEADVNRASYIASLSSASIRTALAGSLETFLLKVSATPVLPDARCADYFPSGASSPLLPATDNSIDVTVSMPTSSITGMTLSSNNSYSGFTFLSVDYTHNPCPTPYVSSSQLTVYVSYRTTTPLSVNATTYPNMEGLLGGTMALTRTDMICTNQIVDRNTITLCNTTYVSSACMLMLYNFSDSTCSFDYLGTLDISIGISYNEKNSQTAIVPPYLTRKPMYGCAPPNRLTQQLDFTTAFQLTATTGRRGDVILTLVAPNLPTAASTTFFLDTIDIKSIDNLQYATQVRYRAKDKIDRYKDKTDPIYYQDAFFCRFADQSNKCDTPFMLAHPIEGQDYNVTNKGYAECQDVVQDRNVDRFAFKQNVNPGATSVNISATVTAKITTCGTGSGRRLAADDDDRVVLQRGVNITIHRLTIASEPPAKTSDFFWAAVFCGMLLAVVMAVAYRAWPSEATPLRPRRE